jgi:hypothetical protein
MDRRNFIRSSAAGAAGAILLNPVPVKANHVKTGKITHTRILRKTGMEFRLLVFTTFH